MYITYLHSKTAYKTIQLGIKNQLPLEFGPPLTIRLLEHTVRYNNHCRALLLMTLIVYCNACTFSNLKHVRKTNY